MDVRNSGDRPGEEVVQLYLRDSVASVEQPVKALKGARRIMLQPGETRTVVFRLGPEAMSLYDRQMRRIVEPGIFNVYAGTNSNDLISTRLQVAGDVFVLAPATPRFR